MSETIDSPSKNGDGERFNHIIAILIAAVTLLAAIVTSLQSNAAAKAAQASRDAQSYAIQAMGGKTSGETALSYQWQGAYQTWAELDDLATLADKSLDAQAYDRYLTVRDKIAEVGPVFQEPYYGEETGFFPDFGAYMADTYYVQTTELSERYQATAAQQNAWSNKAGAHIVQLTLLAVTLALYGLSTTVSGSSRVLFIGAGSLIAVVSVAWMIATAVTPVPVLPDEAIQAYARGTGLSLQDKYDEAVDAFDTALTAAPTYANALYERGSTHYSLAQYEDAAKDYEAARVAGRDDTFIGWNLGWTYYLLGRFDDAIRVDQEVLSRDPSVIGVHLNLALARLAAGRNAEAKADYAEAMDMAALIVADARQENRQPPASLWDNLDAGALDLQNLIDRLDGNVYDWTEAPSPDTIADAASARRIAQEVIDDLKSVTVALEYTGEPPTDELTATITPFEFAREVTDDEGNVLDYEVAESFHYRTKKVLALFDYEGMQADQQTVYKVYRNGAEYDSLRVVEPWALEEMGSAYKPLSYAYSRLFVLPSGRYDVDMYIDGRLAQRGSFTILAADTVVTGQPGGALFRDNFVDPSFADWVRYQDEDSIRENLDNTYHMQLTSPDLTVWSTAGLNFADAQIDVDAGRVGGPDASQVGLICRYQDADNFYMLTIESDGYASIGKYTADEWSALAEWTASEAIVQGEDAINHLRAECVGDRLALYVNDQLAVEARDTDHASGDAGMIIGTFDEAGTNMLFDDFVVRQPSAAGSVLYSEDFSDPSSGWTTYEDQDYSVGYVDGGYRLHVTRDNYSVWSSAGLTLADAQIEADVTWLGGPDDGEYGLMCRYQDGDNNYVFKVSQSANYQIAKQTGGEYITLVDWTPSNAILSGATTNHLRVDCVGDRLALYVNDQLLVETQDSEFASGDIALVAGTYDTGGTEVSVDNLVVLQSAGGAVSIPTPDDGVLYADDFSDPGSGWPSEHSAESVTDYVSDGYEVYVGQTNFTAWATPGLDVSDARTEVSATKVGGPDDGYFGIICRYQDTDNFYVLQIGSDGYYSIFKRKAGEWSLLGSEEWLFSDTIAQGDATNALRADCVGDTLALYVNGELLLEAQDADFASGDIGLLAGTFDTSGMDVLFDDFVVQQP